MTKEEKQERIRRKKIAAKRRKIRMRRRAYALLLLCVLIAVAVLFYKAGAKSGEKSVSENGIASAGAGAALNEKSTEGTMNSEDYQEFWSENSYSNSASGNYLSNPTASMKLDVSTGNAYVDLKSIEETGGNVLEALKDAMRNRAYFTGASNTVNNILLSYAPDGVWHAVRTTGSEICVFFSGHHDHDLIKVTFSVYNDGSFYLQSVSVNDEIILDPIVYIASIM